MYKYLSEEPSFCRRTTLIVQHLQCKITPTTMRFNRLAALTALTLPLLAVATPAPIVARDDIECCDSTIPVCSHFSTLIYKFVLMLLIHLGQLSDGLVPPRIAWCHTAGSHRPSRPQLLPHLRRWCWLRSYVLLNPRLMLQWCCCKCRSLYYPPAFAFASGILTYLSREESASAAFP